MEDNIENNSLTVSPSNEQRIDYSEKSHCHRFLEVLAVVHLNFRMFFLPLIAIAVFISCGYIGCINQFQYWYVWLIPGIYFIWFFASVPLFYRGGLPLNCIRKWSLWKYYGSYFPVTLIKTADLDPNKCYIFGYHPHGVMPFGAIPSLATDALDFDKLYIGIKTRPVVLNLQIYFPIHRELNLLSGILSCSWSSIDYLLSGKAGKGIAVLIALGGATELNYAITGTMNLKILSRKGFIKLALTNGASLVPIIAYGQNEVFKTTALDSNSLMAKMARRINMPKVEGRWLFMPFRHPINVVVGSAIEVQKNENYTKDDVDKLHTIYVDALKQLYDKYKNRYGNGVELEIF